jgi:ABC-type branched-subunit amino acid transport system substrate-binding protein
MASRTFDGLRRAAAAALCGLAALGPAGQGWALDDAALRGKQIYREGTSPAGGEITAVIGGQGVRLPASAVPCASCHGPDGLGRPEGGVLPPDIRWSELTKVYGHVHANDRRHPPFDEQALARLVRTGLDPADNRLDEAMPQYMISDADMADLLAYLRLLELDRDPGVDDRRVQVGTLLPLQGPQGALGSAMAQVMYAHFEDVNAAGGVFGRRIELLAIPYGDSPEATLDNLRQAFEAEPVFALVGAYTVGLDDAILELLRARGVPLVGPFTLNPGGAVADAGAFYIYPGFAEQARVLAEEALDAAPEGGALVLVGPDGEPADALIAAAEDQIRRRGGPPPVTLRYPAGGLDAARLASDVQAGDGEALIFFGTADELPPVLDALAGSELDPRVYLLSSFVPRALFSAPASFQGRIFVAFPTLSSDLSAAGRAAYQRLAQAHALPPDHLQGQIATFAAAKLLEEGLRRAGRGLSRDTLVEGLEALYAFDTGLTPPLSYGPNRRVGARGAHVVAVDLEKQTFAPSDGWHELR